MTHKFTINKNIHEAETLPAYFYRSQDVFDNIKEAIFLRSWHWVGDTQLVPFAQTVHPLFLLDNYLSEPLVLVKASDQSIKCFSNVCTHRGNIVVLNPGKQKTLQCMYHGRRFHLDGTFKSMPEFDTAENFPRPCDNLHEFPTAILDPFIFVSLNPLFDFNSVLNVMKERIGFLPLHQFNHRSDLSKDYLVNCHWALYCDNYLEGFHIPFVHDDLNSVLDYGDYTTVLYDHCNLQIGYTNEGEEVFDLPKNHIDYGKQVAAYYYWIFPNMMFNFYPWGLSINIVKPLGIHKTKVSFITYVYDETKLDKGAGALLDKVEREDEFVVELVNKGMQSRFYNTGRFSPTREQGVHHFHSLLSKYLN
ncbi:aromatic ring-hydroxylating dioxygenase subunit alpha [Mangrovimonas sp. YM274]|uniref:aromatic ring-hydroxylating oxygenase subunit alpha n=1 Tax=Mangrovimonas sp. YM274 TaxID=3070660 RepID=UPI0027DB64E9|nr:aromatic ring-hydroxylating dioxygenase subunit alpha [Mangrovimonas sp. YM274]WMI67860.1 aromatic ring-hydroxylating dioxygenase subunit alpha [Mangrovimonas sp. YM274]